MLKSNKSFFLGGHVSAVGGISSILERAEYLDINSVQCFTKNNRQWHFDLFLEEEKKQFIFLKKKYEIKYFLSHACYLINLISDKEDIIKKSLLALKAEVVRCDQIEFDYIVVHPGSNKKYNLNQEDILAERFIDVCTKSKRVIILLENSAGQGSSIPFKIEELVSLYKKIKRGTDYVGLCLDTAHLFASGYNIFSKKVLEEIIQYIDNEIGLESLKAMHLNDSKKELGSHVDRHQNIGEGYIGEEAFEFIMNHNYLKTIPKILETPFNSLDDHKKNLITLLNLAK